ncbi:MAG: peptide ABC transporter substrate-binding protein [Gammaproteobacteria bacterium]|nr:peptide ABC transporter substrate-binding protein [Gammaproteobacteria bacterium]
MQVLHRGNGNEPESLDPHASRTDSAATILRDLFEGLVTFDAAGALAPGVAESWKVSPDGMTYRFTLRPDARWSNGTPVTPQEFAYSFRRLVDPATAAQYAQMLEPIVNARRIISGDLPPGELGVEARDDRTLIVRLESPTPYLLGIFTHPSTFPVHPPNLEAHGRDFARPGKLISNGAFRLTGWVVGSHVTAERNPHYRDNGSNAIDEVQFHHIVEQASEFKRYRAGELDFTYTVPPGQFDWIEENLGNQLHISPALNVYFYGFNLTRPPFEDELALRKALSMAVDREQITGKILGRGEIPAFGWVPPGIHDYEPQSFAYADWDRERRLEEARRLYAEAGYSEENPARFELRYNTGSDHERIAVAIQSMWKEALGAEATLVNEEFRVLIQNMREKKVTEMFRSSWIGDYDDAYTFAQVLGSRFGLNMTGYHDPAYDRLLAEAATETDLARRREILEEAERVMLADHPVMPIYFYVNKSLVKPRVRGWQDNIMNYHYSRHLSLAAEE